MNLRVDLSQIPDGWYLYNLSHVHRHWWTREDGNQSEPVGWVCRLQRIKEAGSMVESDVRDTPQHALQSAVCEIQKGIAAKRWVWCK